MIKAESKGGERSLRSASPHRNAYKSDFHAIKCSFDGQKSEVATKAYANGSNDTREDSRGRPFGTRVNKIKNIFLQMDGQQQDCQDIKVTAKSDAPQMSPTKVQFPVNTHRVNLNSTASPESQNLDKTPKGEDAEIDKVALAEKFSVTRKLFERGIKEQPVTEKQSSNRVVTRLSIGSASDDGKSTRRVSGSSETTVASEQVPSPAAESRLDEKADGEKRHVSRASLNAAAMTKRLGNYMADNESEDTNTAATKGEMVSAKQPSSTERLLPTSPTRDNLQKTSPSFIEATNSTPLANATNKNISQKTCAVNKPSGLGPKPSSPGFSAAGKPVPPAAEATNAPASPEHIAPDNHGYKRSTSSGDGCSMSADGDEGNLYTSPAKDGKKPLAFQSNNMGKYPDRARSNDGTILESNRAKQPSQDTPVDPKGVGMVRAELVVVKNESSESEENEDDNINGGVFEDPINVKRTFQSERLNSTAEHDAVKEAQRMADTVGEGNLLDDAEQIILKKEKREDVSAAGRDGGRHLEEDEEMGAEESELEEHVGRSILDRASPVVYGIENAAFVDDKDVDQVLREEEEDEEEEEEDQSFRENDVCYELPGLSDEEEPPKRRKIKFSADPIIVSLSCSFM